MAASADSRAPVDHRRPDLQEPTEETNRSLVFDMPSSLEDTGYIPAEMLRAMNASKAEDEKKQPSQEEDIADSVELTEAEVSTAPWRRRRTTRHCYEHRRRMFKNHMGIYRLKMENEPSTLENKNAASVEGIFALLAGNPSPSLEGWGLKRYNQEGGVLEVNFISYTKFGTYQACNFDGKKNVCKYCTRTKCCCGDPPLNTTATSYVLPGRLKTWYTVGEWYSFPADSLHHTWNQYECPSVKVSVPTLVDKLRDAGKCGYAAIGECSGSNIPTCAACLRKIPYEVRSKIFHELLPFPSADAAIMV